MVVKREQKQQQKKAMPQESGGEDGVEESQRLGKGF